MMKLDLYDSFEVFPPKTMRASEFSIVVTGTPLTAMTLRSLPERSA